MWSGSQRSLNYNLGPEMGMVGLRDVFVVAPAASYNHHHHHHHHDPNLISDPHHSLHASSNPTTALGVGVGVIPLLTAGPCLASPNMGLGLEEETVFGSRTNRANNAGSGIQLWQQNQQYLKKSSSLSMDHNNNNSNSNIVQNQNGGIGIGGGLASSSSTTTCQDCGNQAKKDCNHRRCRTCCKSRGFDCNTHVKSTWVPASRRRERQLIAATTTVAAGSSGSTSGAKKPRLLNSQTTTTSHTSTSNTTPPRSLDTSSSHQDASFKEALPGQVRTPAVFKCVRVTAVDDGEDEYAYQAVVKIGGHVFKGFLYDQGVESGDAFPNVSELHLGDGSGGVGGRNNRNGASSSCPFVDPSDVYNASGGGVGFLGGSTYGNQIN